jgi:uncharacterized MAPEG superfamily protein
MMIELKLLGWSVILGLVYIMVAATLVTHERGLKWNAGARDAEPKPLSVTAARAARASRNFLETFPFFAALVLGVIVAGKASEHTALGAELYFWARVIYLPLYLLGIPYLRTAVWAVSFVGILDLLPPLLN